MSISIGAERTCPMVSVNVGLSHQRASFVVDEGDVSGRMVVKVDRQAVVRVFIASYTRCTPLIWISTHAQLPRIFGAFPPSSFLQSSPPRQRATIPRPSGSMVQDRPRTVQVTENALLHRVEATPALFALTPTLPCPAVAHPSRVTSHSHI